MRQDASLNDFIVAAAHDATRKAIEERISSVWHAADQRRVFDLLSDPPPLNDAMDAPARPMADCSGRKDGLALRP